MNNIARYLPSKKFAILLGILGIAILGIIFFTSLFGSHGIFSRTKTGIMPGTVGEVIAKDSNNNGIPDWEESLWGLDPKGDGKTNKSLIEIKRQTALNTNGGASDSTAPLTATDELARSLLSTILALQQSGNLTPEAVANIAASVHQNISSKRDIAPAYTISMVPIASGDAAAARSAYKKSFAVLLSKAQKAGIGTEFDVIANGLSDNGDASSLAGLGTIGQAYLDFAKGIMQLPTPRDAAFFSLELANADAALGNSLIKTQVFYSDIATGLVGIDEYTQSINAFSRASADLASYLSHIQ